MLKALLIGDKDDLDAGLKRDFRRLGISHILAISGTHFSVLLGMAAMLLRLLRLNKKQIYVLLLPLALLYMGISGFSPSVCRAGIMAMLSYLAFLLGRTRDACTALFVAVCALIACHPYAVLDVGLWLSFAATFSILILSELFSKVKVRAEYNEKTDGSIKDRFPPFRRRSLKAQCNLLAAVFFLRQRSRQRVQRKKAALRRLAVLHKVPVQQLA